MIVSRKSTALMANLSREVIRNSLVRGALVVIGISLTMSTLLVPQGVIKANPIGPTDLVAYPSNPPRCAGKIATITSDSLMDRWIMGTNGNDVIVGSSGDDKIDGGGGNDLICGFDGNDSIYGGEGSDIIYGGDGRDFLAGQLGTDIMYGGNGYDTCDGNSSDERYSCEYYPPPGYQVRPSSSSVSQFILL